MKKKLFISTPIYYVNSIPHLGHAYSTLYADFLARFYRQHNYEVVMVTGSDQHGQKIVQAAKKSDLTIEEFIQQYTSAFRRLWEQLQIKYDYFVETHYLNHQHFVQEQFEKLLATKTAVLQSYDGWYCVGCEMFVQPRIKGELECSNCQNKLITAKEFNYFFIVQQQHKNWIKQQIALWQEKSPNLKYFSNVTSYLNLADWNFSISREKVKWGIPLKDKSKPDLKQTAYVWIDALFSYISALPPKLQQQIWAPDSDSYIIHVIGKEISRFHLIYWPLLLKATSFKIPDRFLIHGWLLNKSEKMSKSKHNAWIVQPYLDRFGVDVFRLFMASIMFPNQDLELKSNSFEQFYNTQIVNNLSNFCYRVGVMAKKYHWKAPNQFKSKLQVKYHHYFTEFEKAFQNFEIGKALQIFLQYLDAGNKYIETIKPWKLVQTDTELIQTVLTELLLILVNIPAFLYPISPNLAKIIQLWFNIKDDDFVWDKTRLNEFNAEKVIILFKKYHAEPVN